MGGDFTASGAKGRWLVSVGVGVAGAALVSILFHAPEVAKAPVSRLKMPAVMVRTDAGVDAAFDEKKLLDDPTPLFLPTPWNAARKGIARPEPGATFQTYPPVFGAASSERELKLPNLPSPVEVPASPVDALVADRPIALLSGFGQSETARPAALMERGAFVEIVAEGTGRPVLRQALLDARPPGEGNWQPMEFLAAVSTTGLIGSLAVTRRSGAEGVDEYFQRYLVQTLRVGQRLAPGFYRICVGP